MNNKQPNQMESSAKSVHEMAMSSSWVVEIERYISGDAGDVKSGARARGSDGRHSIYRVPEYIKDMTNPKFYRPQVVSLGPFHHGDPALKPMEKHKCRAVANLIKRSGKPLQEFIAAVEEIKVQLQDAYEDLDDIWRHGTRFVEMMLKDGCFLLEMATVFAVDGKVEDYEPDDPVFSEHGCLYLFGGINSDVVLMENQLPLRLLHKLAAVAYPNLFKDDGVNINNWVLTYLCSSIAYHTPVKGHMGLHPLDVLQKSMRGTRLDWKRPETDQSDEMSMPCASELHEAGIDFKVSDLYGFAEGVYFEGGVLNIPEILLYNAERIFLNLMAFERLHVGAGNDVTAFVIFMDLLIDTAKDVSLLRSRGIIKSGLGCDEVVADLVNKTLTKGAVMSDNSSLWYVLQEVNAYYKKPWNKLRANFIHTYVRNPWAFISLVAAIILLIATVMQTIYTIVPFYKSK